MFGMFKKKTEYVDWEEFEEKAEFLAQLQLQQRIRKRRVNI